MMAVERMPLQCAGPAAQWLCSPSMQMQPQNGQLTAHIAVQLACCRNMRASISLRRGRGARRWQWCCMCPLGPFQKTGTSSMMMATRSMRAAKRLVLHGGTAAGGVVRGKELWAGRAATLATRLLLYSSNNAQTGKAWVGTEEPQQAVQRA